MNVGVMTKMTMMMTSKYYADSFEQVICIKWLEY